MSFGFGFGFPRRLTSGGGLSPSLYLDFVGTGVLPSTVTFSRGTNATLTDSNGRVAYAPHNLLTNSEDFEASGWTKASSSVSANSTIAPDGTTTADSLIEDNTLNSHRVQQSISTVTSAIHIAVVYAKKNTRSWIALYASGANVGRYFDLNNGVTGSALVGAPITSTITDAGNGWYRCAITFTATATTVMQVYLASADNTNVYTGDGTSGIYIWGAQLNVANAPVNLFVQSSGITGTWNTYTDAATFMTPNAITAPDGTNTGILCTTRTGNAGTFGAGTLSYSFYVKQGTSPTIRLDWSGYGGQPDWLFTFSTLTLATNGNWTTAKVEDVGNGWFRISATTSNRSLYYFNLNAPIAGQTFYTWGAQVSYSTLPLPYVATTSSIYLPPAYNSTTPKNLLGFTQEPENAAWTKSNSYVQQNLLTWSQDFDNAIWVKNSASISANSTVAPDGTTTADTFTSTAAAATHNLQFNGLSAYSQSNVNHTASVSVKAGTHNFVTLSFSSGSADAWAAVTVNLSTGTSTNTGNGVNGTLVGTPTVVSQGSGWYRISLTARYASGAGTYCWISTNSSGTPTYGSYGLESWTPLGTETVIVWGAQLVQGSTAGDYTQTTSAAAPTRYVNWDGTLTGRKLVEDTAASSIHLLLTTTDTAVINGTRYTSSLYARAAERSWIQIAEGTGTTAGAYFNLASGVVGTVAGTGSPTASIQNVGGGWYRCTLSWNAIGAAARLRAYMATGDGAAIYTGDGTSGIYVSDFQLSNSASVDPYVYNPQAAAASAAYYGPRFDYNPTGTPATFGAELIANPTFTTDTWWLKDAGVTISGGTANWAATAATFQIYNTGILTVGTVYKVTFTITSISSGGLRAIAGSGTFGTTRTAPGTYTEYLTAVGTGTVAIQSVGASTTASVDDVSYQAVTGYTATANGLLIEEARTNLLTYSEQFNNAVWTTGNTTISPNQTTAPDGTVTADLLYPNTTGTLRWVYQTAVGLTTNIYTRSVYAKAQNKSILYIDPTGGGTLFAYFNLATGVKGTVSAGYTSTIQAVGNGWYRCTITNTANEVPSFYGVYGVADADGATTVTANGTDGIFVWGAQLEVGSFATSYIPTVASQVTRNADNALILGDNFYNFYNPNAGALTATFQGYTPNNSNSAAFGFDSGTPGTNVICVGTGSPATSLRAFVRSGGVSSVDIAVSNGGATGSVVNEGLTYNQTNANAAANGTLGTQVTPVVIPGGMVRATIGQGGNSAGYTSGWYRRIGYYNTRLPDSTLVALTS